MAKLGQNEFPEVSLTESIELAQRIYEDLGGEVRRDSLAIVLGMSPTGGAYGARVGALRIWGLTTGRGFIRLTQEGVRIAAPSSTAEGVEVARRLAAYVPLFNELHDRLGDTNVDQSVLAVMLQEITGAEMDDVMRRVAMVERIFNGIRGYLDSSDSLMGNVSEIERAVSATGDFEPLPRGWMELRYDDGKLRMRETVASIDTLIVTLERRRDRLLGDE